ncbi:putative disease resistance protein At3g14460 [Arachis hypogaea]|uniref:putative disease resistance protein At3g14460 n=1 Tax=Arachis hypogaea TaxID=3818 RepID=UPI003B221C6F
MLKGDMLNHVLMRIVSSSMDVSKVRQLEIQADDDKGRFLEMLFSGDTLSFSSCESMVESAFKAMMSISHLSCLQEIYISECSSLISLSLDAFPSLKVLEIKGCSNLESVSTSEPPPKSLRNLRILNCQKLEFLQQQHKYELAELQIEYSCDSLSSLSLDVFPNLKNLQIKGCENLESVSMSEAPHAALQRLSITYCDKLVSFAGEGLAAPNLTYLQVEYCEKLEALPRDMKNLLPSLHSLHIHGCSDICRLAEGGLPPNLKALDVEICEQQMRDLSWMANLHALTHLRIVGNYCYNIKSYPEVGSLPHLPSLTTLDIRHFQNLETLECNQLLRLTSLQQLYINWCPKLENMEGENLPPSLLLLEVYSCGLLGEHCKNKHQPIWSKIAHIPTIEVDWQQIF